MADHLKDHIAVVQCDACRKPFHLSARPKSDEAGEEEVKLDCPYCNTTLLVKVPRRYLARDTILRGTIVR